MCSRLPGADFGPAGFSLVFLPVGGLAGGAGRFLRERRPAQGARGAAPRPHSPSFRSQPSRSGLKNVCVRSLPSSSGILNGSFLMLSYKFCEEEEQCAWGAGESHAGISPQGRPAPAWQDWGLGTLCVHYTVLSQEQGRGSRGRGWGGQGVLTVLPRLTLSSSSGRSPPSLMPRFMVTNRSAVGLSRTLWLCRLVLSMMIAKDST